MANFSISATTLTFPDGTTMVTAAQSIPSGTKTNFFQAAAPTGWTQCTTYTCYSMRIVNGTGGGTGGTVNFTTAFASQAVSGTISNGTLAAAATTLSTCQIPSHSHGFTVYNSFANNGTNYISATNRCSCATGKSTTASGGGGSHTHTLTGSATFSGTAINLAVKYIDNIMALKS